jgi:hypothetical protein
MRREYYYYFGMLTIGWFAIEYRATPPSLKDILSTGMFMSITLYFMLYIIGKEVERIYRRIDQVANKLKILSDFDQLVQDMERYVVGKSWKEVDQFAKEMGRECGKEAKDAVYKAYLKFVR